jgi:hypothetical protein
MSNYTFQKTVNNGSKTIDSGNITVGGIDLTAKINQLIQDNVTEEANIAGCAILAGDNAFSGTNTMNALTIPSSMAVSSSAISLSKLPRMASTITPTDNKDLSTKQYTDDSVGGIVNNILSSNNTFTGANTFNNSLVVQYCCGLSATGVTFSVIPKTDIDRSNQIMDDNQFITKKYADTQLNNMMQYGLNQWGGTNTYYDQLSISNTGSLYVDSCCNFSSANGATFSVIPKTLTDLTSSITNNNQLVNKKYVDNKVSSAVQQRLKTDRYIVSDTTTTHPNSGGGYWIIPPKVRTGGGNHVFYINFDSSINANGMDNILLSQSCVLDFNYYFTQASSMANISAVENSMPWLSTYSRTTAGQPSNADIPRSTMGSTNRAPPITSINSQYVISTNAGSVCVGSGYQATILYPAPKSGALTPAPSTITTKFNATSITGSPLKFSYVTDNKIMVEIWFPLINGNNTTSNNPSKNDWVSSYGCSVEIKASPVFYDQSVNNTVYGPELIPDLNTNSGNAYITLW